ncbi:MAG: response regulator [Oscillospiraceae bacterium]|nr:response regulator [Oscillospiraceae bacterium]
MNLILSCAQISGIMISMVGIAVLIRREQNRTTLFLMLANIGCLLINCCYLLMLHSAAPSEALVALKLQFLGNILCFLFLALFILEYLRLKRARPVMALWLMLDFANLFCLWNGRLSQLVYRDLHFSHVPSLGIMRMDMSLGILQILRYGLISLALLCGIICMTRRLFRTKATVERKNLGRLVGTMFVILVAMNVTIHTHFSYDIMPICASICVITIITGVIRGELLSVVETGREWVVEHMGNPFVVVDPMYGYLDANTEAKAMFPCLQNMIRNSPVPKELQSVFRAEEELFRFGDRSYEKTLQPIEQDGDLMGYGLLLMDVTERETLLEELRAAKQKAEDANEAKSTFMSNMSHEIRTPMNAIVGMTEILLRKPHPEQDKNYLQSIRNSGNALLSIINDILDFSKIESNRLEVVEGDYDPMSLLHDLSMIFLNRIGEKPVELLYDVDTRLPAQLYGDALRVRQVIINLMNNAIKFTVEGFVRLRVEMTAVTETDAELLFTVEDSGQGIRAEDIPKLFGMYQQVDTKKNHQKEGTGLGLAISRRLVELMGGELWVESEYGKGSRFFFRIRQKLRSEKAAAHIRSAAPVKVSGRFRSAYLGETLEKLANAYALSYLSPAQVAAGEQVDHFFVDKCSELTEEEQEHLRAHGTRISLLQNPMTEHDAPRGMELINKPLYSLNFTQVINGEQIVLAGSGSEALFFRAPKAQVLIVDDNEMNRKVAVGLLEPLDMQIDLAENGKTALAMISKKKYDIIFMDHMMPVMDGVEATRALREMDGEYFRHVPVVALTANVIPEAQKSFFDAGMNDFAAKPIKLKEIAAILRRWLPADLIENAEEPAEDTPAPETLPPIEGIDTAEGLRNCGSRELFYSLLGDFHRLIDMKSREIESYLAEGLLRSYTIEVHALKNTARMIGAVELSREFYELEQIGNREDPAAAAEKTPAVLAHYRSYKPILAPYAEVDCDTTAVSVETMRETLQRLADAIDSFDLDAADAAMAELGTYEWREDLREWVERLRALVADVAMENVLKTVQTMMDMLSENGGEE